MRYSIEQLLDMETIGEHIISQYETWWDRFFDVHIAEQQLYQILEIHHPVEYPDTQFTTTLFGFANNPFSFQKYDAVHMVDDATDAEIEEYKEPGGIFEETDGYTVYTGYTSTGWGISFLGLCIAHVKYTATLASFEEDADDGEPYA